MQVLLRLPGSRDMEDLLDPPASMAAHENIQSWSSWYTASLEKLTEMQGQCRQPRSQVKVEGSTWDRKRIQKMLTTHQMAANQQIAGKQASHSITALHTRTTAIFTSQTGHLDPARDLSRQQAVAPARADDLQSPA